MTKPSTVTHKDDRGSHIKFYTKASGEQVGFGAIHEAFITSNNKGTLRGLHRQLGENTQQKIIKAITGKFNVRVVIPDNVEYYKETMDDCCSHVVKDGFKVFHFDHIGFNSNPIMVPAGALLGYVSLEDDSKMLYLADNDFKADEDDGFSPYSLDIDWGFPIENVVMSIRDAESPKLIK